MKNKKIGIATPWVNLKNAEYECIERIRISAKNIGIEVILFDNYGNILDTNHNHTGEIVNQNDLELVLSLHYQTPKYLDSFYYGVLWNPPDYIIKFNSRFNSIQNCNMYDAFLTYQSDGIISYANAMLRECKGKLCHEIVFVSSPADTYYEPSLENPMIFYCGINFDRPAIGGRGRHDKIFSDLEEEGIIKIFGPKKIDVLEPWSGYESYSGEIPFDGISIMKEINKCGVVLVLASEVHRKYDVVTSRIYEAAAGGAVVIAYNSDFIKKEFGDCVLFIDYPLHSHENVSSQIINHFKWIKKNPLEAKEKANKLQEIFLKKFSMTRQLTNLIENHKIIQTQAFENTYSKHNKTVIDINLIWDKPTPEGLQNTIENINSQTYTSLRIIAMFDSMIYDQCILLMKKHLKKDYSCIYVKQNIFNKNDVQNDSKEKTTNVNYSRNMARGRMISQLLEYSKSEYASYLFSDTIWFSDHITTLKRTIEDNPSTEVAYSGCFLRNNLQENLNNYETLFFKRLSFHDLCRFDERMTMGSVLISKSMLSKYHTYLMDYFDDAEVYLLFFIAERDKSSAFSFKMTSGIDMSNFAMSNRINSLENQEELLKGLFRNDFSFPSPLQPRQNPSKLVNTSEKVTLVAKNILRFILIKTLGYENFVRLKNYLLK